MRICFIPHIECGNRFRYDSTYFFDDFMISLEISLIKYFSQLEDIEFIIKAFKDSLYADILGDYIREKKYRNIFFQDGDLSNTLKESDLAIIDFPSSTILEANKANIPTLVLSYPAISIRKDALKQYKNIELFQYVNQKEIIKKISEFIIINK
tara:strand:+ start:1329 stop:1787 length:459 start_codon:yes stop_codon:yes gene_type:complete